MSLDLIKKYWDEAKVLTADLQPDNQFSTPELVTYLNDHLPLPHEDVTKTKVNYLRDLGILKPKEFGGEIRTSWRYTVDDVRRALAVELLKTQAGLSIKEIKVWLSSFFEEERRGEGIAIQEAQTTIQEMPNPIRPTPVSLAYALLRNRTLGALIAALSFGEAEVTPPGGLIGIRTVDRSIEKPYLSKLTWNWDQVHELLEKEAWTLAVSDSYFKLYVYTDLKQLQHNRPAVANKLPQHGWYILTLQDTNDQFYQIVLGLPQPYTEHPSIKAIERSLTQHIKEEAPLQLRQFPGLSTLLRTAFVNQPDIKEGTTLSVMAEIIATASDAWDYCNVLVPEPTDNGENGWLHTQEYSSKFPSQLKDKRVAIGQPLTGWCYLHRQSVVVEPTAENDPRIAYYEEEGRPIAAAAVPAITERHRVMGVLYVARHTRTNEERLLLSEELLAGLKAFGYVCGDIIARDQSEIETISSLSRLSTRSLRTSFSSLEDLLQRVADEVQKGVGVSPEKVAVSWIYLLTLSIQDASKDSISQWLCQQGRDLTSSFLASRLWDSPHSDNLPIGQYELGTDQYVFAILQAVDLPESQYKKQVIRLQQEMQRMRIGRLSPDFYPSAITFRYKDLRQQLGIDGLPGIVADLKKRTLERLTAGPYFKRGHAALYTNDLDHAVSEFEDALRYVPSSWYGYKHLAEARMLQGTSSSIEEAIEKCQNAIKLNPHYASAHCLLADCYSYRGRFGDAMIEYEKALHFDHTRHDFLTRYGLALASMSSSEYQNALNYLYLREPDLAWQRTYLEQPWLEAIDKFDRVRKLSTSNDTPEEQRERRANYYYYRGYAYLQANLIDKAVEEFAVGRKLAPDNLQLMQAYSYASSLRRREEGKNKTTERG